VKSNSIFKKPSRKGFKFPATIFDEILSLEKLFSMKKIFTLFIAALAIQFVSAQTAYEGKVEYSKKDQETFAIDFPYSPKVVEDALLEKMASMGFNAKESKGFRNFKNTILSKISAESMDYIFRVERKSRKEKDESIVYMLIYKADANIVPVMDAAVKDQAKSFLNDMVPYITAYNLEVQIKDQDDVIAKAIKKQANLEDDLSDLEKKKKRLEESIEENKKEQEKQKSEIEKQRQVLDAMKKKRKS
jgi:hypothetical protein